jgi:DNA-directed RNA polymerase beta subunit
MVSGEGIDVISGTLGIYSRMNFGQVSEAIISKGIKKSEEQILADKNNIPIYLNKLAKLASNLNREKYSLEIQNLANNYGLHDELVNSIKKGGLYFEAPSFTNINVSYLRDFIESEFNVRLCEPIKIKRETFKYIKDMCNIDLPLPSKDLIYPKIFNSSVYFLKLMQLAESKLTARDFGSYSAINRQPIKDKVGNSTGSRLGGIV